MTIPDNPLSYTISSISTMRFVLDPPLGICIMQGTAAAQKCLHVYYLTINGSLQGKATSAPSSSSRASFAESKCSNCRTNIVL